MAADALLAPISAGAILAKTARDAEMARLAADFPGYGFERHKGYGTQAHLAALRALGPQPDSSLKLCAGCARLLN